MSCSFWCWHIHLNGNLLLVNHHSVLLASSCLSVWNLKSHSPAILNHLWHCHPAVLGDFYSICSSAVSLSQWLGYAFTFCCYVLYSLWGTFAQPATWVLLAVADCLNLVPGACSYVFFLFLIGTVKNWQEKNRWRKRQKGRGSGSNPVPPLSAIWHLVICTELNQRPGTAFSSYWYDFLILASSSSVIPTSHAGAWSSMIVPLPVPHHGLSSAAWSTLGASQDASFVMCSRILYPGLWL